MENKEKKNIPRKITQFIRFPSTDKICLSLDKGIDND